MGESGRTGGRAGGRTGGGSLQIFDLARKAKVSAVSAPDPVVHWSWVGDGTVAVVTAKSVFHWKVEGSSLEKVFDRHASLPATMQVRERAGGRVRGGASVSGVVREGDRGSDG